jgi:hypothetical protein
MQFLLICNSIPLSISSGWVKPLLPPFKPL